MTTSKNVLLNVLKSLALMDCKKNFSKPRVRCSVDHVLIESFTSLSVLKFLVKKDVLEIASYGVQEGANTKKKKKMIARGGAKCGFSWLLKFLLLAFHL